MWNPACVAGRNCTLVEYFRYFNQGFWPWRLEKNLNVCCQKVNRDPLFNLYLAFYHIMYSFVFFSVCRICIVQFRYVGKRNISRYAWERLNNDNMFPIWELIIFRSLIFTWTTTVARCLLSCHQKPDLYIALPLCFQISTGIKISIVVDNTALFVCVV